MVAPIGCDCVILLAAVTNIVKNVNHDDGTLVLADESSVMLKMYSARSISTMMHEMKNWDRKR